MKKSCKIGATIISYILSLFFIMMGFYQMCVYDHSKNGYSNNAYVGGDLCNYIINATYSVLFYVLGVFCSIIGIAFILSYFMDIE